MRLVADSGGAAVLAHPASLRMTDRDLADFVRRLRGWGLAGIEVHRPDHTPERRRGLARAGGAGWGWWPAAAPTSTAPARGCGRATPATRPCRPTWWTGCCPSGAAGHPLA